MEVPIANPVLLAAQAGLHHHSPWLLYKTEKLSIASKKHAIAGSDPQLSEL